MEESGPLGFYNVDGSHRRCKTEETDANFRDKNVIILWNVNDCRLLEGFDCSTFSSNIEKTLKRFEKNM